MSEPGNAVRPETSVAADRARAVLPGSISALLMLAVALTGATRPRLSWDEVTSAEVSQRTLGQIWRLIHNVDAVFGTYYAFLRFWTSLFGDGELSLRLPSILAMAAAVGLTAELGRRLFTPLIGLTAGVLLVIVPNTSRYAAEARPYAFVCFFSMLSLLLLLVAVGGRDAARTAGPDAAATGVPAARRRYVWVLYGGAVLLLGAFHLVALSTLAAHAVAVGIVARRRRDPRLAGIWLLTVVVAVAPLAPLAGLGARQDSTQLHWVPPITASAIRRMPAEITGSSPVAWLLLGMAVLAVWHPARRLVPVAVLALAPVIAVAVASVLVTPMWVARYMLVALAPLALLAAVALAAGAPQPRTWRGLLDGRLLRIGAVLLLLAAVAVPGQRAIRQPTAKNGPDYRGLAALVGRYEQPGDVIVYPPRNRAMRAGMDYYLRRLPSRPRDVLLSIPSTRTGLLIAAEHPDDAARLAGSTGIWLMVADRRPDPLTVRPGLRELLTTEYAEVGRWKRKHATAVLYRPRR
ncbi:glycosyltransferase family 39 protein [Actinoplanes teichomyceticus]|uniref:glycosyltransferase family 39 protein n=1 Tax=Actinoplanes teichomyceticus TaxID=1867 RepID=UPI0013DDDC27|nr:glycosyltransferase family 39 protein [Actinoplanes teichomyceticus]GIF14472.1 hypothetical protein Ate01nite_45040 [Actinoplanes teichomyceticus]